MGRGGTEEGWGGARRGGVKWGVGGKRICV